MIWAFMKREDSEALRMVLKINVGRKRGRGRGRQKSGGWMLLRMARRNGILLLKGSGFNGSFLF